MQKGEIGQGGLGGVGRGERCFNAISMLLSHGCFCFESRSIARDIQVNCHVISTKRYIFPLISHSSNQFILPPCNFYLSSEV